MTDKRHDQGAELAVLAASLANPTAHAEAQRRITGSDFYPPEHETLWDTLTRLRREKRPVDAVSAHAVLAADQSPVARRAQDVLLSLGSLPVGLDAESAAGHAEDVRRWSLRRRFSDWGGKVAIQSMAPGTDMGGFGATVVNEATRIRDSGITEDVQAKTLTEVLADPDDEPDWLIPGLLERRDRLILTGDEGLGKSHLLRQFVICAAAGIDPWDSARRFPPVRTMIYDCENTENQIRRAARGIAGFAAHYGRSDVTDRVNLRVASRMDIRRDKDLALIHHELDAQQPEVIVIGPLYKLVPNAIQNDDDAAPVLAALDTIRDRGIAMLIEAHSGHGVGYGGSRNMRPRGSSALLGWPEFGYGLRDLGAKGKEFCEFVAWRGNRSERDWPKALRRATDGVRWVPHEGSLDVGEWAS